jgi:hypothetical protein
VWQPREEYSKKGLVSGHAADGCPLPAGWVELVDPGTQVPYYFHEATQEVTWERPTPTVATGTEKDPDADSKEAEEEQARKVAAEVCRKC